MNKSALLKKLESMFEEFERTSGYGLIEIQFSDGTPALLRKSTTEKLASRTGENRAQLRYER